MQTGTEPQPSSQPEPMLNLVSWSYGQAAILCPPCLYFSPLVLCIVGQHTRMVASTYLVNPDAPRKAMRPGLTTATHAPWRTKQVRVASLFWCTKPEFNLSMARR